MLPREQRLTLNRVPAVEASAELLPFDPTRIMDLWLRDYFPEMLDREQSRYASISEISSVMGNPVDIIPVAVPFGCHDGFLEAFYGRPEAFLDPVVRRDQSAWPLGSDEAINRGLDRLRDDLKTGEWDRRSGHYRRAPFFLGALRLLVWNR